MLLAGSHFCLLWFILWAEQTKRNMFIPITHLSTISVDNSVGKLSKSVVQARELGVSLILVKNAHK